MPQAIIRSKRSAPDNRPCGYGDEPTTMTRASPSRDGAAGRTYERWRGAQAAGVAPALGRMPSGHVVLRQFGSWSAALVAASLR